MKIKMKRKQANFIRAELYKLLVKGVEADDPENHLLLISECISLFNESRSQRIVIDRDDTPVKPIDGITIWLDHNNQVNSIDSEGKISKLVEVEE